jgi:hypothetical protein
LEARKFFTGPINPQDLRLYDKWPDKNLLRQLSPA